MTDKCSCKIDLEEKKENIQVKCYKCDNKAIINSRVNTCKECFINLFSKNFRGNLRTKCLNKLEKGRFLAILASGDYVSTSLIHLLLSRNKDRHYKEEENENENDMDRKGKIKSIKKITDSDDIKLRLIINIETLNDKEEFKLKSNKYFKLIKSVFLKFSKDSKLKNGMETDVIMDSKINDVTIVNIKSCYFLHKNTQRDESNDCDLNRKKLYECDEECDEFIKRCRQINEQNDDLSVHIWRTIKLKNIKKYFINYVNNHGKENKKQINNKINIDSTSDDESNFKIVNNSNGTKNSKGSLSGNGSTNGYSQCSDDQVNEIYLMSGDTMDDICSQAVYLTCLGLGEKVSYTSAFVDDVSLQGVKILRPLRTFSNKEVSFYHRVNELDQMGVLYGSCKSTSSILGCINQFTEELNTRNSNGIHNIIKVTNKLIKTKIKQRCSICESYEQEEDHTSKRLESRYVCNGCNYFKLNHNESYEYFENKFS